MRKTRTCSILLAGTLACASRAGTVPALPEASGSDPSSSASIRSLSVISNHLRVFLDPAADDSELIFSTNLAQGRWQSAGRIAPGTTLWCTDMPASSVFFSLVPAPPMRASSLQPSMLSNQAVPCSPAKTAPSTPSPVATPAKATPVAARIVAYEAWRRSKTTTVPDSQKYSPGLLITPNFDGSPNPHEARLVFKALPRGRGLTRSIRSTPPGLVEFRTASETRAPWIPSAKDVQIPGLVGRDYAMDVSMNLARNWGSTTFVRLDYIVRDSQQNIVARDKIRLLAPVIMPLGDSVTFGFMRTRDDVHMTPPLRNSTGWSAETGWCCYPDNDHWLALPSPYNVPANKRLPKYQGFRGYLDSHLKGFLWKGERVMGHGPAHMGYNGAHIPEIRARASSTLLRSRCYAIVLYFEGLNDVVGGRKASSMLNDWKTGIQSLVTARRRCGKTLVVGITLPRMASHYRFYNSTNQTQLIRFNRNVRSYTLSDPVARFRCADIEGVPHGWADGYQDDGLHFFSPGNRTIANTLAVAIHDGLR